MPRHATAKLWTHPTAILSSLEPPETTVHHTIATHGVAPPKPLDLGVAFRHRGWARNRRLVLDALQRVGVAPARLDRFRACGDCSYLFRDRDDPARVKVAGSFCKDRFCKPCANARSRRIANNLRGFLTKPPYRFATLTLRSTGEPLADLLRHLVRSFRTLRHLPWWRARVTGGVGFVEIKYNPVKHRWHPHLHLILAGTYVDQRELSASWWRITKTSRVVDVRSVPEVDHVLRYVTKYASKPLANTFLNRPDRLDEAINALTGKRLCLVFGEWQGLKLNAVTDTTCWVQVCSLTAFLNHVARREPWALKAFAYVTGSPPPELTCEARASPAASSRAEYVSLAGSEPSTSPR